MWREIAEIKVEEARGVAMIRRVVIALMLFSLTSSADAITLRDYIAASGAQKALNKVYLDGVKEGLIHFDAELAVEGRQRLFCKPDFLLLTFDQAEDIMMRKAQILPYAEDFNIATLLLSGLMTTFPCQH